MILKATYWCRDTVLDVTVPLRFWVTESTLALPEGTKRDMLGFYDISLLSSSSSSSDEEEEKGDTLLSLPAGVYRSIVSILASSTRRKTVTSTTTTTSTTKNARAVPFLTIRYHRAGRVYTATYEDEEAVTLPDDGRGRAARPKGGVG